MKKLTLKQHVHLQTGLAIIGVVLALVGRIFTEHGKLHFTFYLAIACIVASVVLRFLFIKCPHCGDRLLGSRVLPQYCPNCGQSLDTHPTEGE